MTEVKGSLIHPAGEYIVPNVEGTNGYVQVEHPEKEGLRIEAQHPDQQVTPVGEIAPLNTTTAPVVDVNPSSTQIVHKPNVISRIFGWFVHEFRDNVTGPVALKDPYVTKHYREIQNEAKTAGLKEVPPPVDQTPETPVPQQVEPTPIQPAAQLSQPIQNPPFETASNPPSNVVKLTHPQPESAAQAPTQTSAPAVPEQNQPNQIAA